MSANDKKNAVLGMNASTAAAQLKKNIMFKLMQQLELDTCFQCGNLIDCVEHLSVEHKVPWLSAPDPKAAFFDFNNIAFSHLKCNVAAHVPIRCTNHTDRDECMRESKRAYRNSPKGKDARREYNREYMRTWTPKAR